MALEVGMSLMSRGTSMPPNSSAGRDRAGRFRFRPMALGDLADGTPSSPTGVEDCAGREACLDG